MNEIAPTETIVVITDQKLLDQIFIDAQWPEDRERAIASLKPTNLTELNEFFGGLL